MSVNRVRLALPSFQLCALLLALIVLFLMGGSSRSDVQSLAILSPVMIFLCGIAILGLKKHDFQSRKGYFAAIALIFTLVAIYLLPMPTTAHSLSSGVGDAEAILAATGTARTTAVLAAAPFAVPEALFFFFIPLTIFLFAIQLSRNDLLYCVLAVVLLGALSGVIGVLQIAGSPEGPLYFYRITNNGSAVGLFANRNHAATFLACLFPMLALYAAKTRINIREGKGIRQLIAAAFAVILIPLILVTGSRSGMLVTIIGLIGGALLYNSHIVHREDSKRSGVSAVILAVSIVVCLVFATIYFSRALAIERVFADSPTIVDRPDFWKSSLELFWHYFPFGFGPGSFVSVFQYHEPSGQLDGTYLNRLHNDWLEILITYGVPGVLLLLIGSVYYLRRCFLLWVRMDGSRTMVATGRMASIIIAIFAVASISDYPLRTPALVGFAALVLVWFDSRFNTNQADNDRDAAKMSRAG